MVKLYATCKFCDQRVYFDVPEDSDAFRVSYCFKVAMESHLQVHVEDMVAATYA